MTHTTRSRLILTGGSGTEVPHRKMQSNLTGVGNTKVLAVGEWMEGIFKGEDSIGSYSYHGGKEAPFDL